MIERLYLILNKYTKLSGLISGGFLCFSLFAFLGCTEKKASDFEAYSGPVMEIEDVSGRFSDSAKLQFKFTSAKQLQFENEDERYPKGLYLESYDKEEKLQTSLKADYAFKDADKNLWHITKNVVLTNYKENQTLETEELFWLPEQGRVFTEIDVKITTPDQILTGVGLNAKDDFSEYEIMRPQSVIFVEQE